MGRITYSRANGLRLGALATVQAVENHPQIRSRFHALATGATSFAGVQVRNLATVGGNVCNASPAGDTLPALLAFDAQCKIVGPNGDRSLPLTEFFRGPGRTALERNEILTELTLPTPPPNTGVALHKAQPPGSDGHCHGGSSVGYFAGRRRADVPRCSHSVGRGRPYTLPGHGCGKRAQGPRSYPGLAGRGPPWPRRAAATPIDDVRGAATYRKAMVEALTRRTLGHALRMASGGRISFEEQRRLAVQTAF